MAKPFVLIKLFDIRVLTKHLLPVPLNVPFSQLFVPHI